jgi:hypothetical protein
MTTPLSPSTIKTVVAALKREKGIREYTPVKYFQGLTSKSSVRRRFDEILRGDTVFATDAEGRHRKKRKSTYSYAFSRLFPNVVAGTTGIAAATGIPADILKRVADRGFAAYRTGHRVGASASQWASARQKSFAMRGCTWFTADSDLVRKALRRMSSKNASAWHSRGPMCPRPRQQRISIKKK